MAVRAGRALPFPARFVRSENALPLGLLAPTIIFLTLLILIPVAQALLLSFQAVPGTLGFEAYRRMVTDVAFADSLRNTLLLLVLVVPVQLVLALAMALLIHSRFPGHGVFLYIFALPLAISDLAAGIVWLAIFADTGYLNSALNGLGLTTDPINFLSVREHRPAARHGRRGRVVACDRDRARHPARRDCSSYRASTSRRPTSSARSRLKRTLLIVLPMLRPSLQSALIIRTIFAFQTFAVVLALAGRQLPVLSYEAYDWYYNNRNEFIAAAFAALILLMTMTVVFFYLRLFRVKDAEIQR